MGAVHDADETQVKTRALRDLEAGCIEEASTRFRDGAFTNLFRSGAGVCTDACAVVPRRGGTIGRKFRIFIAFRGVTIPTNGELERHLPFPAGEGDGFEFFAQCRELIVVQLSHQCVV